jgi:CRISPR/Cas system CMR subunit Cmr4 (Cas7 group RAMP superfamily)
MEESGSYSVIDTQLIIMPVKSSRRVYTWQLNETILTLTPVNAATPILLTKK